MKTLPEIQFEINAKKDTITNNYKKILFSLDQATLSLQFYKNIEELQTILQIINNTNDLKTIKLVYDPFVFEFDRENYFQNERHFLFNFPYVFDLYSNEVLEKFCYFLSNATKIEKLEINQQNWRFNEEHVLRFTHSILKAVQNNKSINSVQLDYIDFSAWSQSQTSITQDDIGNLIRNLENRGVAVVICPQEQTTKVQNPTARAPEQQQAIQ